MTVYPKGKELIDIFLDTIEQNALFEMRTIDDGVVLHFAFNSQKYAVYFKCVSYAGNPYPQNTTRAQLPQRPEFDRVEGDERFLFLGYDVNNDLYVCWDPIKVRARLNKKSYVSFFCRQNVQDSVEEGRVTEARLTNGDVYVLFKRCDTARFLEMIEVHFPQLENPQLENDASSYNEPSTGIDFNAPEDEDISDAEPIGILSDINNDPMVRAFVDELIAQNKRTMQIISECCNTFSSTYNGMLFKEWAEVINKYMNALYD